MSEVIKESKGKVWAPPVFTVGRAGDMQKMFVKDGFFMSLEIDKWSCGIWNS